MLLCVLLSSAAGQSEPAPAPAEPERTGPEVVPEPGQILSQREQDWIEDIGSLREGIRDRHMAPFYVCSERDAHMWMYPYAPHYDRYFPVSAACFGSKLYLTSYLEGYEQLAPYLLHDIVAVNGVDIAYLNQKAAEVISPCNCWNAKESLPKEYFVPAFFDWAGCGCKEGYTFQILNDNQEVESVEIPTVTTEEREGVKRNYPENWESLFHLKGGEWAEYYEGENGGFVYIVHLHPILQKLHRASGQRHRQAVGGASGIDGRL